MSRLNGMPAQVALQVAPQIMNDVQALGLIAAQVHEITPRACAERALDLLAEAFVAYEGSEGLNRRVKALLARKAKEADEAEMKRRADLAGVHPGQVIELA